MTIYCTYCSADKELSKSEIPAIKRYKSDRITSIHTIAKSKGIDFYILSGKYGILAPDEPIEYYDHLLQSDEVAEHSDKVAKQLQKIGITNIIFFTNPINSDNNLKPYIDCITIATRKAVIDLNIVELN